MQRSMQQHRPNGHTMADDGWVWRASQRRAGRGAESAAIRSGWALNFRDCFFSTLREVAFFLFAFCLHTYLV